MVSLTSLMVLTELFTLGSKKTPKTAYLKLIDVWYTVLISYDFIIISNIVFIEVQRLLAVKHCGPLNLSNNKVSPPIDKKADISIIKKNLKRAVLFNKVGVIMYPAFTSSFVLVIICLAEFRHVLLGFIF